MSREHSYAYEAGYRDGSINYELEHCPACKNVADLQEALAENAKLRELCRTLYPLANNGLMELDDDDFTMVMERMCELRIEVD